MARQIKPQTNFNAGELSPRLYSRSDIGKYENGLQTATNCTLTPHGPIHRRAGFEFIKEVKTSSDGEVRLLKYQFSSTSAYILEFGDLYIRFYKDGGVLGAPYEVTTTYTTAELADISYVQQGATIYLCHPDHAPATLTRVGDTEWTLADVVFSPPPTYEAGETPADTLTPAATTGTGITFTAGTSGTFLDADEGRQITNNSDGETGVAVITGVAAAGGSCTCTILEDFTDTNAIASGDWQIDLSPIGEMSFTQGTNTSQAGTAGEIMDVWIETINSDATNETSLECWRTTDVGKYILVHGGVLQITRRVNSDQVEAEVMKSLNSIATTTAWTLEEATWDATRGYPETVGLYQQRLVYAGTALQPTTLWFSETGILNGFGVGGDDEDSIQVDLVGRQTNKITWMSNSRDLVIGTTGSEVTIDSGSSSALTPSSVRSTVRTFHGSNLQTPVEVSNETIFIQNSELKIRSFRYDFEIDGYTGEDLTFLAEHITEDLVKRVAYAQEPDRVIYAVLKNGDMLAGTYMREQQVLGWSRVTTDGSFEDVQVITNGSVDEVWVVVNRTINGSTVRYLERLGNGDGTDRIHGFSDSYLTYAAPKDISAITAANPGVVTTDSAHGLSIGDSFKMIEVLGMTEVNNQTYIVGSKTSTTVTIESNAAHTSLVSSAFAWTASGSGTNEYYVRLAAGTDPSLATTITGVFEDDTRMTSGTVGSLSASEWAYDDNDSLGYNTVYVRLAGGEDPDTKGQGWVEYALGLDTSANTVYTSAGELHKIVTTISGLSHLEGETVQVKGDGATQPDATVSSGSITLARSAYEVTVGMPYTTTIATLNKSYEQNEGEMQGQRVRWVRPILRVYKSTRPLLNGEFLPSRSDLDEMDAAVELYSGDLFYGSIGWGNTGVLTITTSDPLPLRLGGIFGTLEGGIK